MIRRRFDGPGDPLHREKNRLWMCKRGSSTKISGPGSRGSGGNWTSFSGMQQVVVATTWVDGEA